MKRLYLSILLSCAVIAAQAQTAANYVFSQTTTTHTSLTTGTVLFGNSAGTGSWDDNTTGSGAVPIGFPFWFVNNSFTGLGACANGWVNFGATVSSSYTPLTTSQLRIAAMGEDLYYNGGTSLYRNVQYTTSGTAPTRKFTLQWNNACHYSSATTGPLNFQINLYESSNVVELVYGNCSPSSSTNYSAHVGINGPSNTNFNNRSTLTNWSATTAGTANSSYCRRSSSIKPPNGLTFRWTPPPTVSVNPTSVSGYSTGIGTFSAPQNVTLTAWGLTSGFVTVTAPTNWQIFNGSSWVSSMNVNTVSGPVGTYINTTVQIRFAAPGTPGVYSGNVTFASAGATTRTVSVNGTALLLCSGTPAAGTVTASAVTGSCTPYVTNLSLPAAAGIGGLTFQWQSSPDGVAAYTNVSGATNATYSPTIGANIYYRCNITCSISGLSSATPGLAFMYNAPPTAITGTATVCQTQTTTLSSTPTTGCTWSSSSTSIATVNPSTGVVTGVAPGTANIIYTITSSGCNVSRTVTVVQAPTVNVTPATSTVCNGSPSTLVATSAAAGTAVFSSGSISVGIPDSNPTGTTATIPVSLPAGSVITGVSVNMNMTHTWMGDVAINLKAPNGNVFNLFNRHGGSGNNLVNTTISSTGTTPVSSGSVPFTGTWSASAASAVGPTAFSSNVTSFSSLYSVPNGNWILAMRDYAGGDVGTLTSWSITISYASAPVTTWSPITDLYTDAALTTPYTAGTDLLTVYAAPSATQTYSASATGGGCTVFSTGAVNVNPLPAAIAGPATVCEGRNITLTDATPAGTWSSSDVATATIDATTGVVTGGVAGTTTISYTVTATGCSITRVLTVQATPAPIVGSSQVCEAASTTLTHPDGGTGTWLSTNPAAATVGLSSGIVNGLTSGYTTISYTNPIGCVITRQVTVNPLPIVTVTPTAATICLNESASFAASSAAPQFTLLNQDFNSGLSGWTINSGVGVPVANEWQTATPPGAVTVPIAGDGTDFLQAKSSDYAGTTTTTITSPSFSTTGGFGTVALTFNQSLLSFSPDVAASIEYSVNGGAWTLLTNQVTGPTVIINDAGTWDAANPQFSMDLPSGAIGQNDVKLRWVYNAQSLFWAIDNISVKGTMPASTFAWTGGSGGFSCTNCATPTITPTTSGLNIYNLATTTSAGCVDNTPVNVTVNALPDPISGSLVVCEGVTNTLSSTPGGTWSSGNTAVATMASGTGGLTGVAVGTADITYTLSSTGCRTMAVVTVLPAPADITPATQSLCIGQSATLSNTSPGGAWSTSSAAIADIDATSGLVSGVSAGTAEITYTVPSGCIALRDVTVNPPPAAISGASSVCEGGTTLFTNSDPFGSWTSDNTAIADVDASGNVSGVAAGNTVISYTLPTGCSIYKALAVSAQPAVITGPSAVCQGETGVLSSASAGGTWSSSAPAVAAIDASGIVTTNTSFSGSLNIYYTETATGCARTQPFTVNALPAITGAANVCKGSTVTFTADIAGGTWTSASPLVADVNLTTGEITGINAGTTAITYTSPSGCVSTRDIAVNLLPSSINGANTVCDGSTINLTDATPLGVWTSSDPSVASVNSFGMVSPVASNGVATISYTVLSSGCYVTHELTVNPLPAAITGTTSVCQSETTLFMSATPGGTWSSSNASILSMGAATGIGTGVNSGTTNVTYRLPTGCATTTAALVKARPATIFGSLTVCEENTTTLVSTTPSGIWSSSDISVATVNAAGDVYGVNGGNVSIMYTLSNGCSRTLAMVVNELPGVITGSTQICTGSSSMLSSADAGGTWTSSNPAIAAINTFGNVNGGIPGAATITYSLATGCLRTQSVLINPLPNSITGVTKVCEGLTTDLNNSSAGGTWTSLSAAVATVDPATGIVMGVGAGVTDMIYTLPTGCSRTRAVTVNPTPTDISGTLAACPGKTSALTSTPAGGVWSSGASYIAGVNTAGVVTGMMSGNTNISYTLSGGCRTVSVFTVNPLPTSITGTRVVCVNGNTLLSNSGTGGTWSTASTLVADIDMNTGVVTGNNAGMTTVTYTLPTGCMRTAYLTVNALPANINGPASVCEASEIMLSSATPGGTWLSANTTIATINAAGEAMGVSEGAVNISYILPTGCLVSTPIEVNGRPADIAGADAVCATQQTTLSNSTINGVWSVDNTLTATIDVAGVLTGVNEGVAMVKYTLTTGCYKERAVVVNPLPAAVTGNTTTCQGSITVLGSATPGGSWTSSNSSIATVNAGGVVAATGVGFSIISYTLPTGCSSNATLVVNALPEPITGLSSVCAGDATLLESNTAGGVWSNNNFVASVSTSGMVTGVAAGTSIITYTNDNGCKRIRVFTVNALPGLITGATSVCPGLSAPLGNDATGGIWTSDNSAMAAIDAVSGVVTATGADGMAGITYTLPTGCMRSRQLTVHPSVDAVTGASEVCKGLATTLSNTTTGGVWVSNNTVVATVDANSGDVTGVAAGATAIAYVMPTGCKSSIMMQVNPLPGSIAGPASVCEGSSAMLANSFAGGSWSSSDNMIAMIDGTGSMSGVATGAATMTYTLPTGCMVTKGIVVNAVPEVKNVTGGGSYCAGGTGVAIGVDGSQAGTIYQLMDGSATAVQSTLGTGGIIDYGNQLTPGAYTVMAVSPQGCSIDMTGAAIVTITPLVTPSVSISLDNSDTVCNGTAVTYTANGTGGGTTPAYTWQVNGTDVGAMDTYTYVPVNGDMVVVRFQSSEACPSVATVGAATTMTVMANLTPSVTLAVGPDDTLCQGSIAVFGAVGEHGGDAAIYTWLVNGNMVTGENGPVYSYQPADNDLVVARLNSSYRCAVTNDVSSNSITMHVDSIYVPIVELTANPGVIVPEGTEVTFTANAIKAGTAPTYQWLVNDKLIAGATMPTYKTSKLNDGDSVTCLVLSTDRCSNLSVNSVVMQITPATGVTTHAIGNSEIRLSPNPNNGGFTVSGTLSVKTDELVSFEVTNLLGQVVYHGSTLARGGVVNAHIQLNNTLANGMYMLNMGIGTERKAFHFVVKQ